MKFIQAIEAEYAALRAIGHRSGDLGARVIAVIAISGQVFPLAANLVNNYGAVALGIAFFAVMISAAMLLDFRRLRLAENYWLPTWVPTKSQRFTLAAFLSISTVIVALLSRYGALAALAAYLLIAAMPLRQWVDKSISPPA